MACTLMLSDVGECSHLLVGTIGHSYGIVVAGVADRMSGGIDRLVDAPPGPLRWDSQAIAQPPGPISPWSARGQARNSKPPKSSPATSTICQLLASARDRPHRRLHASGMALDAQPDNASLRIRQYACRTSSVPAEAERLHGFQLPDGGAVEPAEELGLGGVEVVVVVEVEAHDGVRARSSAEARRPTTHAQGTLGGRVTPNRRAGTTKIIRPERDDQHPHSRRRRRCPLRHP